VRSIWLCTCACLLINIVRVYVRVSVVDAYVDLTVDKRMHVHVYVHVFIYRDRCKLQLHIDHEYISRVDLELFYGYICVNV
jgi:hypothetical protein